MAPPTCPPSAPRSKAGALSCGPQCQGHLLVCISSMDMAPPRLCAGPPVAPGPIDGPRGCVHPILLPGRGLQGGARLLSAGPPQGRRSSSGWCGSGCRSARSSTGPGARPRRQGGARCPPPLLGTYHPHPSTPSLPPPSPPLHTLIPTHPHASPGIPPSRTRRGKRATGKPLQPQARFVIMPPYPSAPGFRALCGQVSPRSRFPGRSGPRGRGGVQQEAQEGNPVLARARAAAGRRAKGARFSTQPSPVGTRTPRPRFERPRGVSAENFI